MATHGAIDRVNDNLSSRVVVMFIKLPYETVRRILDHFTDDVQSAQPAEGRRESPIASNAKRFPPLRHDVGTALKRAELSLHGEQAEYDVMLDRSEAAALREWCDEMCLEVEPPRVNQSDRDKLLAVAHAIDDALESAP
jgi:hypothetical protein